MSSRPSSLNQKPPKKGGFFSQLLEFFGMTPSVQSEYLNAQTKGEGSGETIIIWRCQSCHNPAQWKPKEEKWICPHHPNAKVLDHI